MTGAKLREALGTPQIYRQTGTTLDFPSSAVGIKPPSDNYFDVYEIKTSLTAYELRIDYAMDDSESRLHPVPRIVAIRFELDKRIDINDVSKVLDDIPEFGALCGAECTIAEVSFTGHFSLNLHPKTVSPTQQAEADWIGSFFGRSQGRRVKPTASVVVERGAIAYVTFDEDEGRLEGTVKASWKPPQSGN